MPSRPPPKTSCGLPGKPLPGQLLCADPGNASLQAGSPALQPGYALNRFTWLPLRSTRLRYAKARTPQPPVPGGDFLKVAKTLHMPFRKNRSRPRTKIWFVNAPGLPPAFRSGRAVPRSGLHCRQAATPPLFNHQAPQPPASSGGFKRRSGFYKVAKILPETWRINHTRPRAKLWFVNAPLKPVVFRCGPAGTPRRTRASTAANPLNLRSKSKYT
jgi:hypothetical protein